MAVSIALSKAASIGLGIGRSSLIPPSVLRMACSSCLRMAMSFAWLSILASTWHILPSTFLWMASRLVDSVWDIPLTVPANDWSVFCIALSDCSMCDLCSSRDARRSS
eukprot:8305524-Pyramimonas_sp.AAC.1